MERPKVLLPVEVTDDIMTPLRLVLLPACIVALSDNCCTVRVTVGPSQTRPNGPNREVECVVALSQLVAGGNQVVGEFDKMNLEELELATTGKAQILTDEFEDIRKVCREFVRPSLPVVSSDQWNKLGISCTHLNIIDPVAGQVFCWCTV
jgi:hypothetical protein